MAKPPKKTDPFDIGALPLDPEDGFDIGSLPLDPEPEQTQTQTRARRLNEGFSFDPSVVSQHSVTANSIRDALKAGVSTDKDIARYEKGLAKIKDPLYFEMERRKGDAAKKQIDAFRDAQQDTAVREQEIGRAGLEGSGWISRAWRSLTGGDEKPTTKTFEEMIREREEMKRQHDEEMAKYNAVTGAVTYPLKKTLDAMNAIEKTVLFDPLAEAFNLTNSPETPPEANRAAWEKTQEAGDYRPRDPFSAWLHGGLHGYNPNVDYPRREAAQALNQEQFSKALIEAGEGPDGFRKFMASALTLPGRAGGAVVGTGLTVPFAMAATAIDAPAVARNYVGWPWPGDKQTVGEFGGNLMDLWRENVEAVQTAAVPATLSPLNAVNFGGSSAATNAYRSVLAKTGDDALANAVRKAMTEHAGTWRQTEAVRDAFRATDDALGLGGKGVDPSVAEEIWGPGLRHLGQGQLEVGVPFTNINTPLDTQYGFRKWIGEHGRRGKAVDAAASFIGANQVFDRRPEFAHAIRRGALADEAQIRSDLARELMDGIAGLPDEARKNWLNKKWRDEVYRRAIEPDFTRETGFAAQPSLGPGQVAVRNADKHAAAGGQFHRLSARSDFVPYADLDATFGAGTQQLVDLVKRVQERARQGLVDANYMSANEVTANPISGIYMRRPLQSKHGLLDEIIVSGKERSPRAGANALRQSRVGADDGFPGGLSVSEKAALGYLEPKSTDPAELAADYIRLAARANAETRMRQEFAEAFGREVKEAGDGSAKNVLSERVPIPARQPGPNGERVTQEFTFDAPVANIMNRAFAPAGGQLSRLVRSFVPGETMLGRGAIGLAEGYDKGQQFFKSNVLKSPAYQSTNYYNDTARDMLEGNANPFREQSIAVDMMRGTDGPLKLGELDTTLQEEFARARAAGIPYDLAAAHRFEIDPGKGLAGDLLDAARDPSLARSAYRFAAPPEFGGAPYMRSLGENTETMQKTATYLWWRSRGASPAEAVARAVGSKIDYQYRTPAAQALAPVVPFSQFLIEGPRRTIRTGLRRPGAVAALDDVYNAFDENEEIEPRQSIQEAKFMRLGGQRARLADRTIEELGNMIGAMGGDDQGRAPLTEGVPAGMSPIFRIKDDNFDSLRPPAALLDMNLKPLGETLTPLLRAPVEWLTKQNLATGREMKPPTPLGMFPYGSIAPAELQAGKDQNPWLSTYGPNYIPGFARGYQTAANTVLGMEQDQGPLTTFGGSREYAPDNDRRRAYALQWMNFLGLPFPGSVYLEGPAAALQNSVKRADIDAVLDNNRAAEKSWTDYFTPNRLR